MEKIERSVVMKFTFPASMSLEEQDVILERIKILPYEREISTPKRPAEPDDLPHETRRVLGCEDFKWGTRKFPCESTIGIRIIFPDWIPTEIKTQASKKIPIAAAEIVNDYLSRRFVGTEE